MLRVLNVIYWIRKEWLTLESQEVWTEHHSCNQPKAPKKGMNGYRFPAPMSLSFLV